MSERFFRFSHSRKSDTPRGIDRRALIGSAAIGALALAGGSDSHAQSAQPGDRSTEEVEVVVIGAGFAGLNAAVRIAQAGKSVRLIEARDRVGGRVVNHALADGTMIEAGGQFVGPTQNRMFDLAKEFGVETFHVPADAPTVSVMAGQRLSGDELNQAQSEFWTLVKQLDTMAATIPVGEPWNAPQAAEWDTMTFRSWADANAKEPNTREMFDTVCDLWGTESRDLSLLFALYYIAAAGDEKNVGTLERLLGVKNAAQEQRYRGGSHVLAQKMADSLGDRLILSSPVRAIRWDADRAEVRSDKITLVARHVVIALPPALVANIWFDPGLPTLRSQLVQRLPMGSLMKILAVYDRPFWKDEGVSGISMNTELPIRSTFDNSLPGDSRGIIVGFVGGKHSRRWSKLDEATRREEGLQCLAEILGDQALRPLEYFDQNWPADPWSRGGPVGFAPPGVLTDYGSTLREPVGPIHWAGTETATYWNGYMEGAVQSGDRVAREVLAEL